MWLEHDDEGEMDPRRNYRGKWRLLHIGPCEKAIVDSGFYQGDGDAGVVLFSLV